MDLGPRGQTVITRTLEKKPVTGQPNVPLNKNQLALPGPASFIARGYTGFISAFLRFRPKRSSFIARGYARLVFIQGYARDWFYF